MDAQNPDFRDRPSKRQLFAVAKYVQTPSQNSIRERSERYLRPQYQRNRVSRELVSNPSSDGICYSCHTQKRRWPAPRKQFAHAHSQEHLDSLETSDLENGVSQHTTRAPATNPCPKAHGISATVTR